MGDTAYTIVAAIFFILSIGFTFKTLAVMRAENWSLLNIGIGCSAFCWTVTALFAGWLG